MDMPIAAEWHEYIDALVRSGRYSSAAKVMEDALRAHRARDAWDDELRVRLKAAVDEEEFTAEEVEDYLRVMVNDGQLDRH